MFFDFLPLIIVFALIAVSLISLEVYGFISYIKEELYQAERMVVKCLYNTIRGLKEAIRVARRKEERESYMMQFTTYKYAKEKEMQSSGVIGVMNLK